jgi:hypothetical protein
MIKEREDNLCINYWKDKKKDKYDQRRKGFKPPFNRNNPNKNQQENLLRMNPREKTPWEKGEDHQSNVGDEKKITCTRISLTEKKKLIPCTTSKKPL